MDCTFKITKSNIVAGLKLASAKYGVPINAYLSFISDSTDENANLKDTFKQKLSTRFGVPVEELDSSRFDDVIKFITDEYNKFKPDVNYSADNESSYTEIAAYGYDSVYAREFAKKTALDLTLKYKRFIEEDYGSVDNYIKDEAANGNKLTKLQAYTEMCRSGLINLIRNRAIERGVATEEEISELIKNRDVARIEELFGKENPQDTNLLAFYKEFLANKEKFVEEAFKNDGKLNKLIYENKELKEIEEHEDIESGTDEEDSHQSNKEDDAVDNYIGNLTHKLGDVGNYMSNIDDNIRIFFSNIPKLVSTEKIGEDKKTYQFDTNNPLGVTENMDGTQCINIIISHSDANNVEQLRDSIKRIAETISGMQGLIQVYDYMDTHKDFAYKLWCNFSKTIMSKTETTNKSGNGFQAAQSNPYSTRTGALKFQFINSFKHSSIGTKPEIINAIIKDVETLKTKINKKQNELKRIRRQADIDEVNTEIQDLINKIIPNLHDALKYYFNTVQKEAIELYITKSDDKISAINFIVDTLKTLNNQATKAKENYNNIEAESYNLREERYNLNRDKHSLEKELFEANLYPDVNINKKDIRNKIKELKEKIEAIDDRLKELYQKEYIEDNFMGVITPFARAISKYSLVKIDPNSRNVHGNLSSDLLNNNMLSNILKTLQNPTALANFGKYKQQSRQYDFSNIMVEHRDSKGNIINYGLFIQNPDTKELTPTPYAYRLLSESLYSGIADVDTSDGALYTEMSKGDYIASAVFNFFRNEQTYEEQNIPDGGPASFANYFMRTPSDAPKNFIVRAPRYSIKRTAASDGLFISPNVSKTPIINTKDYEFYSGAAEGSDSFWKEIAKTLGIKTKDYTVSSYDSLSKDWQDKLDAEYQEVVNKLGRKVLDRNSYSGKLVRRDMMQADKADAIFAVGTIGNNGFVNGGTAYATTRGIIRGIPVYVYDLKDNTWKVWDGSKFTNTSEPTITKHAAVIGTRGDKINGQYVLPENGKQAIISILNNSVYGKTTSTINKNHPVYQQFRQAFIQEVQDAANAIYFIFGDKALQGGIDRKIETDKAAEEETRLRGLYKNYHYKGDSLFEKDEDGNVVLDDNGNPKLSGNVFHSDRFVLTDENGKRHSYGDYILEEAFDFFYGGANSIKTKPAGNGVQIVLTDAQNEAIDRHLEQFLKDYTEQCYNRAIKYKHLFGDTSFSREDLIEFSLNYHLAYIGFNDLFEGDTKFYKSSQDALKRFKEAQGSGVSYGILNYEDDLTADSTPVESSQLNNTTFTRKIVNEDGTITEEPVKIEQRTRFKGVTIKNTVRTGDSIGTFKKDEKGKLIKDANGNYIFDKPGRLSERFIKALIKSGMSEPNAKIHAANTMVGYLNTTVNDAQSYITFEEWVRRISARGQLEEYKPIIDAILDESKPLDAKTISKFVQVQKNFYYDQHYNKKLGVIAPRQIKNAEFVLVPRLIEGTQLAEVYKMMTDAGIDQLNTEETSKAGKCNVLTIWDNEGNITEEAKRDFATNAAGAAELFNYNYLYTQQETPSHLNAKNKAGIQFMKKIIDNIDEKLPNGKDNPLYPLKQRFQDLYVENIISSAEEFADEFGITIDENGNFLIDKDHPLDPSVVYKLLKDEMARQGLDSNAMDYVTLDKFGMPIMPAYMGNFAKKFESVVQGLINNRITRQTLPGFHAAQITNVGFSPLSDRVNNRSYSKNLKYHPDEYGIVDEKGNVIKRISERRYNEIKDKEEKKKYTNLGASSYIEIMLPKSNFNFNRKTKEGKYKSDDELLKELEDAGLDTIIGYRIPTEGKQSMCIMKVVGFIDDAYDSTIVVPDDWVSQTGSDFDIDSVYGIHYDTQLDKDGKIIKAKPRELGPKDYVKYIKKKLKSVIKKENIATSIKDDLQKEVDKHLSNSTEEYESLQDEATEIYKTMNYKLQNIIKEYNKVEVKGETKQEKYIKKLGYVYKQISNEIKTNKDLTNKNIKALKLYNKKIKAIHSFLKEQNKDFLDNIEESKEKLNEELANKLSEIAVKADLPSYAKFKERKQRAINRNVRNNEILDIAIKILGNDASLEENLSRSNFEKLIDARDAIQPKVIKDIRKNRSCYNFYDQADYQEDAMSGAKLKGASVARDTFVSICNTVKAKIDVSSTIGVVYKEKDGYTLKNLKAMFDHVTDCKNGTFIVYHDTIGWTKNNKNVADLLLTPYTSQTTAHILDAIKEGAIPNVNDYTFNVYKTFSDIGCDFYMSVAFMMQPAVSRIVELNNTKNSVFAEQDSNNPIKSVIVEIANKLIPDANYTNFSKLEDIIKAVKNISPISINTHILNFEDLNNRLNNKEETIDTLLYDFKVALEFYHIKKLADEISNNARLLNPDKFGAKQTVFETIDTIDKIKEANRKFNKILYVEDKDYIEDKDGKKEFLVKKSLVSAIYTKDLNDSRYKSLNAFYKYSTLLSVELAQLLFPITHNEDFDIFLMSIGTYANKKIDENLYNSFRTYVLNTRYAQASAIKNNFVIDENGKLEIDPNTDRRLERARIYGLNRSANLFVKDEKGSTVVFDIQDINHPTKLEIEQFATLSPAQKVYYIKNKFSNKGVFEYIEESLTNRGKLSDKQTLKYVENAIDIETIYSEFEKAFFNSNPIIRLAAIDLVKYAYVVEGFKMKKGAVNKVIKNNALYLETDNNGLNIIGDTSYYVQELSSIDNVRERDELKCNYIRSHSDLIKGKRIQWHKTGQFYDKEKTNPIKVKDLTPTSQGIIIVDNFEMMDKYNIAKVINDEVVYRKFVKLIDDNVSTLYRVYTLTGPKGNTIVVLAPQNLLEENESEDMSINTDNNKYQRPSWYEAVIDRYSDSLYEQEQELYALENQSDEVDEAKIKAVEKKPKYTIKASVDALMAEADLYKYVSPKTNNSKYAKHFDINAKDTPYTAGFEEVIDAVTERFDVEKGSILIMRSPTLTNFITSQGRLYGSKQEINGTLYNIDRVFYGNKNRKYIKENKEVQEKNADVQDIFVKAQKTGHPVNDTFIITKVNDNKRQSSTDELIVDSSNNDEDTYDVRYSSTEELNKVPTTDEFNHKTIETMYFRRRSVNDPRAAESIAYIDSKNINSNPKYIEDNKRLITQINADYIVNSINDILTKLNNFQIGDRFYRIDSDEVFDAIKTDKTLQREFLKTILDARAFATRFALIDQIDITSEEPEVAKHLQNIKNAVAKLRSSNIIANAEIKYGNEVLAKLSDNPMIQKKVLGVFDGYHTASLFDAWVNDLQETSNPLLQIVSSQVMKDLRKKEMLAKKEVYEFRKALADIKDRANKAGVKIDWDHIIDDEGKFVQKYNQAFLDKLQELRDKKDKAKQHFDENPKAYYEAKLEFDKWKVENINQEADNDYYRSMVALDEEMLKYNSAIFIKYKTLQVRQSELLSYISAGTLNPTYAEELDKIQKEINALSSEFIGDELLPKYAYDDPNNPYRGELREIYSLEAAYALRDYKKKKKELDDKYFEYEAKFNFDKELERNLDIINSRERRDPNGRLLTPMSELMTDPDYVAAKEWITNNTYFTQSSEIREKLNEAFNVLREARTDDKNKDSKTVSSIAKNRNAYDLFGVVNARLFTPEDIAIVKARQAAEYEINESNPFSDRTLITNAPSDDTVFSTLFYNQMRSNGASNPVYLAKCNEINDILRSHYDPTTRTIHTSELSAEELTKLGKLYSELNDIKKNEEGTSTNGKSIFKFIQENVDFIYDQVKYNEEESKARAIRDSIGGEEGRAYWRKWLAVNNELNENGQLVPNHYLYGYAVPKGYKKGEDNPYIDKLKTEALRYIKEHATFVPTEYYHRTYAEMKAKSDEEFKAWFDANHIYNPYTHRIEPLKCWTTMQVKDDNVKTQYQPKFNYKNRKVKDDKRNTNYVKDGSYAQNYNGTNSSYNNPVVQNDYEKEITKLFKEKINKYAITDQAKSFFKQGYAPIRQKKEEADAKKIGKELLKLLGYINNSTGKEEWLDDKEIDYSKDATLDMPMSTLLKNKDTVDIQYNAPRRKDGETNEEYNKRYDEWYENKKKATAANKEIHKKLLDKDWASVMEEFILKAANFNAIQDNKYMLFYAKNMIDNQQVYVKNFGFSRLQKTGNRTIEGTSEYASKTDEHLRGQYINWLRRIIYDQYKKPNNRLTRFANIMQSATSAKYMMLNYAGGVANVTQGWTQILGERFARDYFGNDWWKGVTDWNKSIGSFIYDMHKDKATSLESGIVQFFNVVDFTEINGLVEIPDAATYISRLRDFAFSPLSIGEHFMQNSALFAMLHSHRLYYTPDAKKDGRLVYTYKSLGQVRNESIDEAFKKYVKGTKFEQLYEDFVKYETSKPDYKKEYVWYRKDFTIEFMHIYFKAKQIKEFNKIKEDVEEKAVKDFNDNIKHPTLKSQLDLDSDGHLKIKDDSDLLKNMTEDEAFELLAGFKGRVISVNKKIHGIYDKLGAARLENKWGGALTMQYHKHIYPGIMKRWRRQGYFNEERGTVEKGTNIALLDFVALPFHKAKFVKKLKADNNMTDSQLQCVEGFQNICKSYLDFFAHITLYFNMLPQHEQANILRGLGDFAGVAAAVTGAIALQVLGSDDDKNGLVYNFFINQADRLASESMSFRSFGIIGEGKKLWSSPVAAQSWIEDIGKALSLCAQYIMEGDEFDPTYTSGIYKGENKFMMLLKRNTPMWHSIYMIERLDKNNKNYKLDENMLSIIPVKKIAEYITD